MTGRIRIYTDGSYSEYPKWVKKAPYSGWACVFESSGEFHFESAPLPTSMSAELEAVLLALRHTPTGSSVEILTDSLSLVESFEKRIEAGPYPKKKMGSLSHKSDKLRWKAIIRLCLYRDVILTWTPGHRGNPGNTASDMLALRANKQRLNPVEHTCKRLRTLLSDNPVPPHLQPTVTTGSVHSDSQPLLAGRD